MTKALKCIPVHIHIITGKRVGQRFTQKSPIFKSTHKPWCLHHISRTKLKESSFIQAESFSHLNILKFACPSSQLYSRYIALVFSIDKTDQAMSALPLRHKESKILTSSWWRSIKFRCLGSEYSCLPKIKCGLLFGFFFFLIHWRLNLEFPMNAESINYYIMLT